VQEVCPEAPLVEDPLGQAVQLLTRMSKNVPAGQGAMALPPML
jgi:hypothetical protein